MLAFNVSLCLPTQICVELCVLTQLRKFVRNACEVHIGIGSANTNSQSHHIAHMYLSNTYTYMYLYSLHVFVGEDRRIILDSGG